MSKKKTKQSVTKKKTGRPPAIDYEVFTKVWMDADSVRGVAETLKISNSAASAIAVRLRNAGVDLKKFPRRESQKVDVKKLNKIVKAA